MCNGLPLKLDGFYRCEPRDPEAADNIAALVLQDAGLDVCLQIRDRIEECLTITNVHRDIGPWLPPEYAPEGIDPRECEVILIVDDQGVCEIRNISIPKGLLAVDHLLV